jgi:hypothetical protein
MEITREQMLGTITVGNIAHKTTVPENVTIDELIGIICEYIDERGDVVNIHQVRQYLGEDSVLNGFDLYAAIQVWRNREEQGE